MLIVGAPGSSPAGAVFTYTRQGGQWVLEQRLDAPQGEVDRLFGYAVATDGERLLVSAPAAEPLASGAVYEYRRRPGGWDAGPRHAVTGIADLRLFGVRIARHGSRWVVGSVVGTNVSGAQRNELFVYNDFGSGLVIERQLGIDYQAGIGNAFPALAVDDQSVLAGLPTAKGATFADAGEVSVVPLLASGGSVTTLSTGVTAKDERFGTALDATANWLLVGAPGERRYSAQTGLVYAWPLADGAPATGEPDRLTVPGLPGGSELGSTLAVSGSTVLVGAPNGGGGSVHAFEHDGLAWQVTASWSPDAQQFVGFGQRLAAQADRFVVGSAWAYGSGSPVLVIERTPGGWAPPMPIAPVDVLPPFEGWVFGGDVALADTTIAVGAPRYFESANGMIFTPDGAVFVFARAGSDWPQVARLGHPAGIDTGAGFGQNVAMRDGWLAVSAPTGGEVHLFSRDANGAWNWRARISGRAAVQGGFGSRLGFVGDELWIAEPKSGSVYRYRRIDADWRLAQRVQSPDASPLGGFGLGFTRIGEIALISAPMRTGHRSPIWSAGAIRLDELSLFGDGFEP